MASRSMLPYPFDCGLTRRTTNSINMKTLAQYGVLSLLSTLMLACSSARVDIGASADARAEVQPMAQSSADPSVQFLQQVLANNQDLVTAANRQIVLVHNTTAEAVPVVIRTFGKSDGRWRSKYPDMSGSGAKNGFAPFDEKAEGDGRAPTGLFNLVATFGYHEAVETRMPYRQSTERDFWIDDVASDSYNQWLRLQEGMRPSVSHERLKRDDHLYEYLVVIDYNSHPVVKDKGSAIFMHVERAPGVATVGCIATSLDNMKTLFKWLDPAKSPIIIMGTESELASASLSVGGH